MLNLEYCASIPGSGKTHFIQKHLVENHGQYVVAVSTIHNANDYKRELDAKCAARGISPQIIVLHTQSKTNADGADLQGDAHDVEAEDETPEGSVGRRVNQVLSKRASTSQHTIVLLTHMALTIADFGPLKKQLGTRWTLFVDEAPTNLVSTASLNISSSWMLFDYYFELKPVQNGLSDDGWAGYSRMKRRSDVAVNTNGKPKALSSLAKSDSLLRSSQQFFTNIEACETLYVAVEAFKEGVRSLQCVGLSDLSFLDCFHRVVFFANDFQYSMAYKVITAERAPVWSSFEPDDRGQWASRDVVIKYFSNERGASRKLFTDKNELIEKVFKRIVNDLVVDYGMDCGNHFWTINHFAKNAVDGLSLGVPGEYVKPLVAGRNDLMKLDRCSIIYAAKAGAKESDLMKKVLGISSDDIKRARECEALIQFVLRSSLRDPESVADVLINVFDVDQAEFLKEWLFRQYGFSVSMVLIEDEEIAKLVVKQPSGVAPSGTAKTNAEYQKAWRAREKAKKNAKGVDFHSEVSRVFHREVSHR